jgi:hypothetical protein
MGRLIHDHFYIKTLYLRIIKYSKSSNVHSQTELELKILIRISIAISIVGF